jgi:small GTP-binding protein
MDFDYIFKYIVIGNSGVGKSCIVNRFISDEYTEELESTIGVEFGAKVVQLEGEGRNHTVKLQIWDTAGQETFQSITRSYYRSAAGALLVYDITNKETLTSCENWLNEARTNGNEEMVICLVGNKSDLVSQ